MLSGIGAVISAIAIIIAARLGKGALDDYKRQRLIDREIDAAEQALTAAYRAFEAVSSMRGRFIYAHETEATESALRDAGMPLEAMAKGEKSAYVTRGVIYRRAEFFRQDFDAVFECIPLVKVYFGQEAANWLQEFPRARNRMLSSADMLPTVSAAAESLEDRELAVNVRRDIFGNRDDQPDEIRDTIKLALGQLEDMLMNKLRTEKEANV
jgi:hypothetical protein